MSRIQLSPLDRLLAGVDNALAALTTHAVARRPDPAASLPAPELDEAERRDIAGLMRINHSGEICAQALYLGQATLACDAATRTHLLHAADEENDHLAWCEARLRALHARPSLFNPLWYAGSFALGALAALAGDAVSLGFVSETERQVEAHLAAHIERLPDADTASRAVLAQMQADEARHGAEARARGGRELSPPIPGLMHAAAALMKAVAYRM